MVYPISDILVRLLNLPAIRGWGGNMPEWPDVTLITETKASRCMRQSFYVNIGEKSAPT